MSIKVKIYRCSVCNKDFSVTTISIFHKIRIPLIKWFFVIISFLSDKKGEVSRKLKITQKTAWKMLRKIRYEMRDKKGKLSGAIEIDKTFVGGRNKNCHYNKISELRISKTVL